MGQTPTLTLNSVEVADAESLPGRHLQKCGITELSTGSGKNDTSMYSGNQTDFGSQADDCHPVPHHDRRGGSTRQ